jgi:hypothetical protein
MQPKPRSKNKAAAARRGRPPAIKDERAAARTLAALGQIQATPSEAAAVLRLSLASLERFLKRRPDVKAAYEAARLIGRVSLRRALFRLARGRSSRAGRVAIFLSKVYLDMSGPRDLVKTACTQEDPFADLFEALEREANARKERL